MLTYYLVRDHTQPLYEQLYEQLKQSIVKEEIKQYEKMPSKRALANHLKVSLSTIELAYQQLLAEGYIYAIEKKGYFVHYDHSQLTPLIPLPKKEVIKPSGQQKPFADHFKTNLVDAHRFPLEQWLKASKKMIDENAEILINQSDSQGIFELRYEIKSYLKQYRGMDVSPDQIIMGAGSEVLLSLISDLIGHQKKIGVENPGYHKINHILRNKHHVIPIPLDKDGMMIDHKNSESLDVIHITPSHQFPSGIVMPIQRRLACLTWANQITERYIIEDDYDSEFRFVGQPIEALYALDRHQKVIYINSFSKSLGPTMRLSYMVLPTHLLKIYQEKMKGYRQTISNLTQYTLSYFMKDGVFYKHLNRMKVKYKQKRDELIKQLKSSTFGHKIDIINADAGLHFILKHHDLAAHDLSLRAKKNGIEIKTLYEHLQVPIKGFEDGLVMGYAHISIGDFPRLIHRLEQAWKDQ
ncbi:MAG: PLP-dependent aminotransferase family protein [Acholeplasmataceae bacterium]